MKKLKKEIMLTIEIEVCQMKIEKEKKIYEKSFKNNYKSKRKCKIST